MNEIKFSRDNAIFDDFGRFSIKDCPFIKFETGEVVLTNSRPAPDLRTTYDEYGVTIFDPSDSHAPLLYSKDGQKIPKAWFKSIEYLVWDHETDRVVSTHKGFRAFSKFGLGRNVPVWARRFACYWAGPGAEPVGGSEVKIYPPLTVTKEAREFVAGFKGGFDVIVKLERGFRNNDDKQFPTITDLEQAVQSGETPLGFLRRFNNNVVHRLSAEGLSAFKREAQCHTYLVTKGGSK